MTSEDLDSAELRNYRLAARAWLADNMTPLARDDEGNVLVDRPSSERYAHVRALQARLFEGGFAGITYPTEYGGAGLDLDHERVFLEEGAGYDLPTRDLGVSLSIIGQTLLRYGSDDQKRVHLPRMLRGDEIWLQLLSEPSGGSDLAGLVARADRDGSNYVLNGQKTWSTGALFADFALCPARTNWDVPKHRGISLFIVDLRAPGIEIRPIRQIDGGAEYCEEFLTDVVVSADDIVGAENDGWTVVRALLAIEHEWVGRTGGSRSAAYDTDVSDLVSLVRRRGLEHDDTARRRVAEVRERSTVQRVLVRRISGGMAEGSLEPSYGNLLKLGSGLLAQMQAEAAFALAGSAVVAWPPGGADEGVVTEHLLTRRLTIASGTSEVQRNAIAEGVLGLPREVAVDRDRPFREVLGLDGGARR
jgi:alkylation response protein AidB-like acyl-CoA dehydrogenase